MGFDMVDKQYRRREVATSGLAAAAAAVGLLRVPETVQVSQHQWRQVVPPRLGHEWQLVLRDWGTLTLRAVGSRCTCDPPPMGTDQDWLAQAPARASHLSLLRACLEATGWTSARDHQSAMQRGERYPDEFESWRRDEDNLILALHSGFYDSFMVASYLARRLNLLRKEDRIALFQAVLYQRGEGV